MAYPSIGLALIEGREDPKRTLETIERAEQRGVRMVWATLGPRTPDAPTLLAAAAARTSRVGLGTAIVPTYPRHPVVLATQALVLARLAPDRVRIGIGPSHRSIVQQMFGLPMGNPLEHLREYATILRRLLWDGHAEFEGRYYTVHLTMDQIARVPIYFSALRPGAFELAGELADGAISWLCPLDYLRDHAVPALQRGAERAGHDVPRLVAQVPVVMTTDREVMLKVASSQISHYTRLPYYAAMFARAGFDLNSRGGAPSELIDQLVVWGNEKQIQERLAHLIGSGIDELALNLISATDLTREEERLAQIVAQLDLPSASIGGT